MSNKKNKMWGGRFSASPAEVMQQINASIDFDKRLYAYDIAGSKVHAKMLAKQKIISQSDFQKINKGLDKILREIESGKFKFKNALEDIHMNIEARLAQLVGDVAGKLHTARSRNDQVATDFKLFIRDSINNNQAKIVALLKKLLSVAEKHQQTLMPGFTHLQTAQPISFAHHCLAYVEMLYRDFTRFENCLARMNESPLGACALAGTSFPIDRKYTAKQLGFREPMRNSLDAVASRDFALEYLSSASICALNVSRLAEEIILWSTPQFNFISLSDKWSTGSSIMPQKRNADAAELIRAKVGAINGAFINLATVMKALPLAYAKDMQEDKLPIFATADNMHLILSALEGMIGDMKINKTAMATAANTGYSTATDIADWLVQNGGVTFRKAHEVVGKVVALAAKKNCQLEELSLAELKKINKGFTEKVFSVISAKSSMFAKSSFGGTSPKEIEKQLKHWKGKLK